MVVQPLQLDPENPPLVVEPDHQNVAPPPGMTFAAASDVLMLPSRRSAQLLANTKPAGDLMGRVVGTPKAPGIAAIVSVLLTDRNPRAFV